MDGTDYFVGIAQQALWILALASAPILIPALITGILLGMVQAATSINEATLSFVPKLLVVALCLALFGTAILMLLVDFTNEIFARIPELTR
jgi:flagellar biosynthetic protein FliQ